MSTSAKIKTSPETVAVIGLGLMGGSLAAACRKQFPGARIVGISRSRGARAFARRKGWVDMATEDLASGLSDADLIVLCTPVDTFSRFLDKIDRLAPAGAAVTDVGSIKGAVVRWAEGKKFKRIQYVGAHPMTGLHERGITVAAPDLFEQGYTFLVRSPKTSAAAYARVRAFWKKINGRVFEVSAAEHDRITASVSHLPHALSVCLMLAVSSGDVRFAAKGLRDMTRIAQGDPSVWVPIFALNRGPVLRAISVFEKKLKLFRKALGSQGVGPLKKMIRDASRRRKQI